MSFTYTQSGPSPVGTLNLNSAHLKLTFQNKKLIFFNDVSLGGEGSNVVASNTIQAPGFQFANTGSNGLIYASNGVFNTAGSAFSISGNTLTVPNLTVSGNLTVNGTLTTVNTTTIVITDPIVQIGANVVDSSNVGLILTGGPSYSNVAFGFQPGALSGTGAVVLTGTTDSAYGSTMTPTSNVDLLVYGNVRAEAFIGDGGLLSNITATTSSNLQDVTTNGNVTTNHVTLGGLTTTDSRVNGLFLQSPDGDALDSAFVVGHHSNAYTAGDRSMAIGNEAGATGGGSGAISVGFYAGNSGQGNHALAVGYHAADETQGFEAVSVGHYAGQAHQGQQSVAIGSYAGQTSQNHVAVAIGNSAGRSNQGHGAVAIGDGVGQDTQGSNAVGIGSGAASTGQGSGAVAIGENAGSNDQQQLSIAIGTDAGNDAQGSNAVAIGSQAGHTSQQYRAVAIGNYAGRSNQGSDAIAIGSYAGSNGQLSGAVAIGGAAGGSNQGQFAVAIGQQAGSTDQGQHAVAIGYRAGETSQHSSSIMLNASGASFNTSNAGFYVNPVRYVAGGSSNVLGYNTVSGEIFDTGTSGGGGGGSQTLEQVVAYGNTTSNTVIFSNALAMVITGNVEMASTNMNVYSVSSYSVSADNVNVTELRATIGSFNGNVVAHGNVIVDVGVYAGSLSATGAVSGASGAFSGRVSAGLFSGDGGLLTNVATTSNLQAVTLEGAITDQTVYFSNATTGLNVSANVVVGGVVSAASGVFSGRVSAGLFSGDGGLLTNVATTSNLQSVVTNGAITNRTVTLSNATTGLNVSSNVIIGGNVEVPAGNMNVYSVSSYSVSADNVNATEVRATTVSALGDITSVGGFLVGDLKSNVAVANVMQSTSVLATNMTVTDDLTVDGITTVQVLKFTPYSGLDPDTGNTAVIATATGGTVTVSAAGVAYGSNVINLSGYSSPITAFNLTIDNNAQLYLFAPGVSVNTTSTATVKFTNPTPITSSNVLFHVTKIMNAGFSVVNAIVVD
jgi:hypothetical protein